MKHKAFIKQIFSIIVGKICRFQASSFKLQEVGFKFQVSSFKERGVALYLAIFIMIGILAIVFGVSVMMVTQIEIIRGMEDSVIAFHAADSGIEYVLNMGADATTTSGSLDNGATWAADVLDPGTNGCPADTENFCIDSRGTYQGVQRAIQISR